MASDRGGWPDSLAHEAFCYVTTTGRRTGRPHLIEIWFGVHTGRVYILSQNRDRADWVRNLLADPVVEVRIGRQTRTGRARVVDAQAEPEEDALARRLIVAKYEGWREGQPMSAWAQAALPVDISFPDEAGIPDEPEQP